MLANVVRYSGIYAKTCALKSSLLTLEDYYKLASCTDLSSFADILGEKESYKEAVAEAFEYGTTRVAIERSLVKSLYRDYAALFSFMTDQSERRYFDVVFLKYEIGIIKRLLRRMFDHRKITNVIPKYDKFLSQHIGLDVEKVSASTTFDELLESLKGTEFYGVLSKVSRETGDLFDYEMQLDFHGYVKTQKFQDRFLTGENKKSQRHINGCDADLHNIMWIYRAKTYYEIDEQQLFTYLIPVDYHLTKELVQNLVKADTSEAFFGVLDQTIYKDTFDAADPAMMEKQFALFISKQYDKQRRLYPYSLAPVMAHLYFKGQEIRNLTTLIECVRYHLTADAALEKLNINLSDSERLGVH